MRQIESGVYLFSRASILQYVLIEKDKVILIDTGLALFSNFLIRELEKLIPDHRIQRILITHADGDHTGAAEKIRNFFHSRIAASLLEAEAMRLGRMSRPLQPSRNHQQFVVKALMPLFSTAPIETDDILVPGQTLPIFCGLEVLDSAGHTPGHLSFYLPRYRVLFAGDSIVERNHVPSPAFGYNCWDEPRSEDAFQRQMALNPLHLCCGHSYFKLDHPVV